jgi:hypothetical protein
MRSGHSGTNTEGRFSRITAPPGREIAARAPVGETLGLTKPRNCAALRKNSARRTSSMASGAEIEPTPTTDGFPDERLLTRNFGRGPGQIMLNMRVGRTFRFGVVREAAAAANTGGVGGGGNASGRSTSPFGIAGGGQGGGTSTAPPFPDTVSWVVPTSMALITLERARNKGLIRGRELQNRLRLGTEMLLDRACPGGGWNAGNAVVYGVPLRPHIDATALALAALRSHNYLPIVRNSLTWILNRIDCPSACSLAWVIVVPENSFRFRIIGFLRLLRRVNSFGGKVKTKGLTLGLNSRTSGTKDIDFAWE